MADIIILLLFFGVPAAVMFFGYRKYRLKAKPITQEVIAEPDDKVMLHGHDLAKWNYLGYCRCSYVDETGATTSEYPIFLFVDKKNEKRRSYHISGDTGGYVDKSHNFVNKYIKTWAAGEGELYHRIQGEHSNPSDYLKEYMLDKFGAEWDSETHWWGSSDKAKYKSAQNKQKRERKPKTETKTESNVVTVEFGKQA